MKSYVKDKVQKEDLISVLDTEDKLQAFVKYLLISKEVMKNINELKKINSDLSDI